jgi:hypothetical protein
VPLKRELDTTERILSAMLRLHRDQCSTYRRFVTFLMVATAGLVACVIHRRVEQVVDLPVDATAVLALAALVFGMAEMRTLRRAQVSMQELWREHRLARLRER